MPHSHLSPPRPPHACLLPALPPPLPSFLSPLSPPFPCLSPVQIRVNYDGVVSVTTAFLPLLKAASFARGSAHVLATSSGVGARTIGLLSDEDRDPLLMHTLQPSTPPFDTPAAADGLARLRAQLVVLVEAMDADPNHPYRTSIPTPGYGISKMGVNICIQMLARAHAVENPSTAGTGTAYIRANACSPGFTNTRMCDNYTGARVPKEPALGASVFGKVMFGELGRGHTGAFFKEASKAGTPLENAVSKIDAWVQ